MIISPCMDCEERYPACHSKCKKYYDYISLYHEIKRFNRNAAPTIKRGDFYYGNGRLFRQRRG